MGISVCRRVGDETCSFTVGEDAYIGGVGKADAMDIDAVVVVGVTAEAAGLGGEAPLPPPAITPQVGCNNRLGNLPL